RLGVVVWLVGVYSLGVGWLRWWAIQQSCQPGPWCCLGYDGGGLGPHHFRAPPGMGVVDLFSRAHHFGQPHLGPDGQHFEVLALWWIRPDRLVGRCGIATVRRHRTTVRLVYVESNSLVSIRYV